MEFDNGNRIPIARGVTHDSNEYLNNLGYLDWSYNPLDEVEVKDITSNRFNLRLQGGFKWDLTPDLSFEIKGQYECQNFGLYS